MLMWTLMRERFVLTVSYSSFVDKSFHRIELTVTESSILEIGHRASGGGFLSRGRSSTYSEIHCGVWNGLARCIVLLLCMIINLARH